MSKYKQKIQYHLNKYQKDNKFLEGDGLVFFESMFKLINENESKTFDKKVLEIQQLLEADEGQRFFSSLFSKLRRNFSNVEPPVNQMNVYYLINAQKNLPILESDLKINNQLRKKLQNYQAKLDEITDAISDIDSRISADKIKRTTNPVVNNELSEYIKLEGELEKYRQKASINKGLASQLLTHEKRIEQKMSQLVNNLEKEYKKINSLYLASSNPFEKSGLITPRTSEAFKYRLYEAFKTATKSGHPYFTIEEMLHGRIHGDKTKEERTFVSGIPEYKYDYTKVHNSIMSFIKRYPRLKNIIKYMTPEDAKAEADFEAGGGRTGVIDRFATKMMSDLGNVSKGLIAKT